jgi:hypothetical protein
MSTLLDLDDPSLTSLARPYLELLDFTTTIASAGGFMNYLSAAR